MALALVERLQLVRVGNAGKQFGRAEKGTALRWDVYGSHIMFSLQTSVLAGI